MEKTLKGIVQYARKNYFSYWAILGIDTALSVLCSLLAYAVIHYMAYVPMSDWILCKFICQVLQEPYYSILIEIRSVFLKHESYGVLCVPYYSR